MNNLRASVGSPHSGVAHPQLGQLGRLPPRARDGVGVRELAPGAPPRRRCPLSLGRLPRTPLLRQLRAQGSTLLLREQPSPLARVLQRTPQPFHLLRQTDSDCVAVGFKTAGIRWQNATTATQ